MFVSMPCILCLFLYIQFNVPKYIYNSKPSVLVHIDDLLYGFDNCGRFFIFDNFTVPKFISHDVVIIKGIWLMYIVSTAR